MKRFLMLLLTGILAVAMAVPALAEQTTLTYSYGADARNKHMLSVENTVEYAGETYTFTTGGFDFESVFMLTGGNTRTVYELEVPRIRLALLPENEAALLGTVRITAPADMTYRVFSGDRVSGQYTLVDSGAAASYTLEICAERDAGGTLRLIDKVFLFSYQKGGEEKHYAASLYISYEGVAAAPAEGAPASAAATADEQPQISPANLAAELATYTSMVRILEEERTRLCAQLADKDAQLTEQATQLTQKVAEITRLNGEVAALTQQVADKDAQLTEQATQLTQKDAEITRLNGEVAALTQQVADKDALTAQLTQKDAEITRLNGEVAALTQQVADKDALTAQLTQKDAEITRLNGEVAALTQQNTQLTADKNAVTTQLTAAQTNAADAAALQAQIATLETEKAALRQEAQQAVILAERVAQLEQELIALRSMPTPTAIPTEAPTATPEPTAIPTAAPATTSEPTSVPTEAPTATHEPTAAPTAAPTATPELTAAPTEAPTAVPVQTADTAITFRERAWGSSADEIAQWLLQEGIVTNQYSLLSGGHAWLQPCYYSFVFLNAEGRVPEQNPYQSTTKMIWASEFLSPDFRVFGYEVENLYFSFRSEGDATRLIGAAVDLKCPEGEEAAFADVQSQLRALYGQGNADDSTVYLRLGQSNTAVHLARRPYDGLILTWGDTTAVQTAE